MKKDFRNRSGRLAKTFATKPIAPVPMTRLFLEIMKYGTACEKRGKYGALALDAKLRKLPQVKQAQLWTLAYASTRDADRALLRIGYGWGDVTRGPVDDVTLLDLEERWTDEDAERNPTTPEGTP